MIVWGIFVQRLQTELAKALDPECTTRVTTHPNPEP